MMTFSEFKKYIDEHYLDYLPEEYSKGEITLKKIRNVVKEATKSIIAKEEFLSDNIYKYI